MHGTASYADICLLACLYRLFLYIFVLILSLFLKQIYCFTKIEKNFNSELTRTDLFNWHCTIHAVENHIDNRHATFYIHECRLMEKYRIIALCVTMQHMIRQKDTGNIAYVLLALKPGSKEDKSCGSCNSRSNLIWSCSNLLRVHESLTARVQILMRVAESFYSFDKL